jgi:PA14 domain-containing protein
MIPAVPRRTASRVLAAALAAAAAAWLLGEQGVRVGTTTLPAWDGTYLAAGALALFLLAPPSPHGRGRSALAALALLAACAFPVDAWRRAVRGADFPVNAQVRALSATGPGPERSLGLRSLRLPRRSVVRRLLGRGEDVRLDVTGFLYAPESGRYRFEVRADDACTLTIDGVRLVGPAAGTAETELARGTHALALTYVQERGAASLSVSWDRPGFVELLPLEHHLADAPGQVTPRRLLRKRLQTLGALGLALAWCAAAALAVAAAGESKAAFWRRSAAPRVRSALAALRADPHLPTAAAAAALCAVFLAGAETVARRQAPDGLYLQKYTSEYLMQTVSVVDLRDEPLRSLWYLHIQPPMLDAVRAALAQLHRGADDAGLLRGVDAGLYVVWGVAASGLCGLVCLWLCRLAGPRYGLAAAAVWTLHPASVFYATLLDGTLLSAAGIAWFVYELWRARGGGGSVPRLLAALLFLFFTRSVVQWPFLVVTGASLVLLRLRARRVAVLLCAAGLVMGAYLAKQRALFGVAFTSSFAADSFCKGLHEYCLGTTPVPLPELPPPEAAHVLSRVAKSDGEYNYNQLAFLRRSFAQMAEYRALLRRRTLAQNLDALRRNLAFWLRPSSSYTAHLLVDRLPWRGAYDALFGGPGLVVLLGLAGASWTLRCGRERWRVGLSLALPVAYVFTVTVLFEGGENMRYKFFVEPVLFVFLAAEAAAAGQRLRRAFGRAG